MARLRLTIGSDLEEVSRATQAIRDHCATLIDEDGLFAVELSVAEALTNIVSHGYAGASGTISVEVDIGPVWVKIEISDRATPAPDGAFQPNRDPFAFETVEDMPERGMGMALIRMNMDDVSYESGPSGNRLRMARMRRHGAH